MSNTNRLTSTAEIDRPWISEVHEVALGGDIDAGTDLSGVVVVDDFLILGADEGHQLQILRRRKEGGGWGLVHKNALAKQDQETDIEAITYGEGSLYVTGSHSARRRLMREDLSSRRNQERLLDVRFDASRNRLYRIAFDPATGRLGKVSSINLTKRLRKDPLLQRFCEIPSKENGIDIEGLAWRGGELIAGFRGPVLRANYVPVMRFAFDKPKRYRLAFVRLDGQGIRDLVAVRDGFLVLSGPVNDGPGPYRLWWWDGKDQVPGKDRSIRPAVELGEVSTSGGAKAEGLALCAEDDAGAEVIVVYETETAAQAVSMRLRLPR